MRLLSRRLVLSALLGASATRALAQAPDYPSRSVTFIVPFAPGGVTTLFARILETEARAAPRQAVRGGEPAGRRRGDRGGGGRACHARRLHHHDGVEHGARDQCHRAQEPALRSARGAHADRAARARAVRAGGEPDAADPFGRRPRHARQGQAGQIAFGTPGPGTFHHLNAEMFKGIFGLDLVHVPYKGSAPALNDLVGGHIQMMFCDVPPALTLIQSGKVRALGVTTKERVPALMEVARSPRPAFPAMTPPPGTP